LSGRDVWAIVSDLHCGSTLGLCPPSGVQLDDGGWYTPSYYQKALWGCWEEYWQKVKEALRPGDRLFVVVNGDWVDGNHHGTAQIISPNLAATQHEVALATIQPAIALNPTRFIVIRGTEVHVGSSGGQEEALAKVLPATIDNDKTGAHSWWHWQCESEGVLMDFAHHGAVGKLPHTRSNPAKTLAVKIMVAAAKHGTRMPDVVYRSHAHQAADTFSEFPCRVIQTRAWQLSTAFVERIAAGSLPEIGAIIQINEGGQFSIHKFDVTWEREAPCQMARFAALSV
jgi:hypothetical protein